MTITITLLTVFIVASLAGIAVAIWRNDVRIQKFRNNLEAGQTVVFFRAFYSRTEDETIYKKALIEHIDDDDSISLITQDLERVFAYRHELYPLDF